MSSNIEEIQKLYAKKKTYTIPKEKREGIEQIQVEITPMSLDEMGSLDMKEDMPLKDVAKNAKTMFAISLGIPEENVSKISFEFMEDLLQAVMDANNLKEEDIKKTGIKDFIKKKNEQIEAKKVEEDAKSNRPA